MNSFLPKLLLVRVLYSNRKRTRRVCVYVLCLCTVHTRRDVQKSLVLSLPFGVDSGN